MGASSATAARPTWWRPVLTVAAFSALPFAVFLNDNRSEAELDFDIALYALVLFGIGLLALLAADRLRGSAGRERAAVVFAGGSFVFFHFQIARSVAESLGSPPAAAMAPLAIWLVVFVVALVVAARVGRHAAVWNFAAVAGVLLLAVPLIQYGSFKAADPAAAERGPIGESSGSDGVRTPAASDASGRLPDVYFFLLDGYGRADQLQATVDFDNSRFLRSLENRGFTVHDDATSAYSTTFLSLASTLEMGFPAGPGDLEDHRRFYEAIEGDNATVRRFHELGYRFVLGTDYALFDCGEGVDLCVEPRDDVVEALLGEREQAILGATPLSELLPALGIEASPLTGYLSPEDVVERVAGAGSDRPSFVYAHILAPHPPYRYRAGCELKTDLEGTSVSYWGEPEGSGGEEYRQGIECLNRSLLAAVDRIIAEEDSIVVIQGDHGPKFGFDLSRPLSAWSEAELRQRFSILNAQRLPRSCSPGGPATGFAANTFQAVFACITGAEPELVRPRYYTFDSEQDRVERVEGLE
jgi:hypothetical protein